MFDFYYQHSNNRRKLFQTKSGLCTIGSARSNDLIVDSRQMSKRHAELRLEPDGVYLRDLGSLSGSWVNRERIVDHGPLSDLDEIEVGDLSLTMRHVRGSVGLAVNTAAMVAATAGSAGVGSSSDEWSGTRVGSNASLGSTANRGAVAGAGVGAGTAVGAGAGTGSSEGVGAGAGESTGASAGVGARASVTAGITAGLGAGVAEVGADAFAGEGSTAGVGASSGIGSGVSAEAGGSTQLGAGIGAGIGGGIGAGIGVAPACAAASADTFTPDFPAAPSTGITTDSDVISRQQENANDNFDQVMAYWGRIVHEQLLYQMDLRRKDVNRMSDDQLRQESSQLISEIISSLNNQLPVELDRQTLLRNVLNEAVGLGPLESYLEDETITEIMVNNYREIFVERNGKLERSAEHFSSDATVSAVIERIITPLGRRIDESSPIVDARLKDGSRVNAVIPPLALKGPSLTIRKFPKHRLHFSDLVAYGSVSQPMVEFLRVCVKMRKNIVVSGGTGSGKTTLLNVLSNFIPDSDRIVTIEDAAELKLAQPNLVSLESRPSNLEGKGEVPIRDLVRNSLRMRPDRIVVGECRGGEAIDMLQAMNTGHDGSLTTIHANTPRDVLSRLEVLVLMAGMDLPVSAIREQVASAVDMIIQQSRFPCGSRKITRITEVTGVESGTVQLQDIFRYEQQGVDENLKVRGNFSATGAIPTFYEELREMGVEVDLSFFTPTVNGGRL